MRMSGPDLVMSVKRLASGAWRLVISNDPDLDAQGNLFFRRGFISEATAIDIPATDSGAEKVEMTATLTDAYAPGLLAGVDRKRLPCAGVKTTDTLIIQPAAIPPAGYGIIDVVCTENGFVRVGFSRPDLAAGANHSIPLKITALR